MKLYLLLGILVVYSYVFQPSEQCMCMPVHPQQAFCKADFGRSTLYEFCG